MAIGGMMEKARPYILMVGLQCGAAGMYVISAVTLKQGMSRYVLIVYRNAVAAAVIAPFAFFLERFSRSLSHSLTKFEFLMNKIHDDNFILLFNYLFTYFLFLYIFCRKTRPKMTISIFLKMMVLALLE